MNKILIAASVFLLIGAGCLGIGEKLSKKNQVSGDWMLAFDLPKNWVMVSPYAEGGKVNLENKIEKNQNEIYLQNTSDSVWFGEGSSEDVSIKTVSEDVVQISVSKIDARRIVPSEAEDLGDGFSVVKLCEDDGTCRAGGKLNYEYYFVDGDDKFRFTVLEKGIDRVDIEKVIRSAKMVSEVQE